MNKLPLVSVIIPVYKVELYLKQCVEAVIVQSYTNLEIILIDDGSPDLSGEICEYYAKKDNRVRVIHKKNGGLSDARNAGLDVFSGDYIAFIDSDDFVHKDFIKILIENIKDADMAFCGLISFNNEDELSKNFSDTFQVKTFDNLFLLQNISSFRSPLVVVAWNKLYKRHLWENLRYPKGKIHEDEFVIHHLLYKCNKITFCDTPRYFYRQRQGSITDSYTLKNIIHALEAFENRIEFCKSKKLLECATKAYNNKFTILLHPIVDNNFLEFKNLKIINLLFDKRLFFVLKLRLILKKINYRMYYTVYRFFKKNKLLI